MDTAYDVNDTTSAHDDSGPMGHVEDTIRHSISMPHQSHETQHWQDPEVMAEVRKFWSGEAFEYVKKMLTTSFNNPTPKELIDHILIPALKYVEDQLSSNSAQREPLSTVDDARGRFTPQASSTRQTESALLKQDIPNPGTADHVELAKGSVPSLNTEKPHESPGESVNRADNAENHVSQGCIDSVLTAKSLGKRRATSGDDMITNEQLNKINSDQTSSICTPGPSKVAGDAGSTGLGCDHSQLVEDINLELKLDRRDGSDPKYICTIGIRNIRNNGDFFNAIQERSWWRLEQGEEIFRAIITEACGTTTERPRIELGLSRGDTDDRSWDMWLLYLRKLYERERVQMEMNLVAKVLVTTRSDSKA